MTGFLLPMSIKAASAPAREQLTLKSAAVTIEGLASLNEAAADLEAAASEYAYDYSDFGETREEIEAELGPARDILGEMQEIQPKINAMRAAAEAIAEAYSTAAYDLTDLDWEIEKLTEAVAQLEARLASFA